jgi:hypothetical protein
VIVRYGVPLQKTKLPGVAITKPNEPKPIGPVLDEASSAAVDLFAAGVDRLNVTELARRLAVTLGAIERMK